MTIEKSPAAASGHKPAAHATSQATKPRAAAAASAADAAGGANAAGGAEAGAGFLSILGALGDAPAPAAAPVVAAQDAVPAEVAVAAPAAEPLDINALLQQNPHLAVPGAARAALPAAAALAAAATHAPSASQLGPLAEPVSAPLAAALTPPMAEAAGLPARPAPAAAGLRPGAAAARAASDAPADPAAQVADAGAPGTVALQNAQAHARAGRDDLHAAAKGTSSNSSQPAASERAEQGKFMAALEQARAAPLAEPALEPLLAPLLGRPEKVQAERNAVGLASSEPAYAGAALGLGNSADYTPSTAQAAGLATEVQVAEQVSYWVSHNVQNAELTLDGLGQSPVEVSISMQGNAAQIVFRTDELATRELLERAEAQLKDLLQSEGLVLSGVSVGNAGSGQAEGRERSPRHNVRQTTIAPLQAGSGEGGARQRTLAASGAGQSVDLFV